MFITESENITRVGNDDAELSGEIIVYNKLKLTQIKDLQDC